MFCGLVSLSIFCAGCGGNLQSSPASKTQAVVLPKGTERFPAPAVDLPVSQSETGTREAVLAGGCFWCTERVFEKLAGVEAVISGYAGDTEKNAEYARVSWGLTDHAEVIKVVYDPQVISYGQLLHVFFSVAHDPTQKNRQGPDTGRQYRSAIFYASDEERDVAQAYIDQLNAAKVFRTAIVTTLEPLDGFYAAEDYHQDYVANNPNDPYVQQESLPKVQKVEKEFAELIKKEEPRPSER
jgi:peptide-methionine (S)-S-oxide reductase